MKGKQLVLNDYLPPLAMDKGLVFAVASLVSIGLVMVASSSLDYAAANYGDAWYFVKKQAIYLCMGVAGGLVVASIPTDIWQKYSGLLLVLAIVFLVIVLLPGVGKTVNGSRRWLRLGPLTMQASELAKFCLVVYFASYLARKNHEVRFQWGGFFKMIAIIGLVVFLLLLEPDFGSSVVICLTLGAMMFVAGVPLLRFLLLALIGIGMLAFMAVMSPYRWNRLVAFMDPWEHQFNSGYQLVQSLIAFGRGEWFGLGLGNSLQKLFFLPEAHTDFVFAIYAEEFGLIGALLLIGLFAFFVWKMAVLSRITFFRKKLFGCYLVFGIAVMVAVQAFINMGVASGFLPTKGLTLPFISYGGSSLLVNCALVALVFRVAWEERYGCN
ncbi:putative lipid II flippase FtsW [Teredinibacter haidensis]|uniref:putative lipid II flippase FtsW n=1 Tax=Teredinibacter haidensis TaxID=2731755 RepID=UPI000ADB4151|nr:putative lipid II flippase FtsW [Teredinibacter haidensis]